MQEYITTQGLFDRVVKHLLTQGKKSVGLTHCMYRGPTGLKCAIGCLIDDNQYSFYLEGEALGARPVRRAVESTVGRKLSEREWLMLGDLQETHDSEPISQWREVFAHIAEKYKLEGPCV